MRSLKITDQRTYLATSTACGGSIAIAAISLVLGMIIPIWMGVYKYKGQVVPSKTVLYYACIGSAMAFTTLVVASVISAGINASCYEFNRAGYKDCAFVYDALVGVNFTIDLLRKVHDRFSY
jgi:hypothetical protein